MGSAKCSGSITDIYLVFWDHGTHISQWIKTAVKILIIYKWLTVTFIHIWNGLIWMLELTMDKMTYIEQWVTSSGRAKCLWRVQFVFPQTSFNFWLPSKRQSHNVLRVRFTMKVSTTFLLFFILNLECIMSGMTNQKKTKNFEPKKPLLLALWDWVENYGTSTGHLRGQWLVSQVGEWEGVNGWFILVDWWWLQLMG